MLKLDPKIVSDYTQTIDNCPTTVNSWIQKDSEYN